MLVNCFNVAAICRSGGGCIFYHGHSAARLENEILKYRGEFSDPIKVCLYLAATEKQDIELKEVENRLVDLEASKKS
jgi:hypothetical protein